MPAVSLTGKRLLAIPQLVREAGLWNNVGMSFLNVVLLLAIAGVCGFLATKLMGARRINIILMIILGFIGAALGQWVAGFYNLPLFLPVEIGTRTFPVVWALVGSVAIVGIVAAIQQH